MRSSKTLDRVMLGVRIFLAFVFIAYGGAKIFGGQFFYGDWATTKKTVSGPFLVWLFYGYSPVYGRLIGLFELVPAIMLLFRRTATAGAAALFAVSLNVAAMDFAFNFPAVKYAAAFYTFLCVVLMAYDGKKLSLLLTTRDEADAAFDAAARTRAEPHEAAPPWSTRKRVTVGVLTALVLIFVADIVIVSRDLGPRAEAEAALASRGIAASSVNMTRVRIAGSYGPRHAVLDYQLVGAQPPKWFRVEATRTNGFVPWRITDISERAEAPKP